MPSQLFGRGDGAHRASVDAGTAVDADIGIDGIDVTFLDSSGRAFALAGTASDANVSRNLVSHSFCFIVCDAKITQ